jgi:hypothetical protein
MPSDFPRSPRLLKGAIVAYQLPQLFPTIVAFQYNPEHLTRSVQGRSAYRGGRGDVNRTDGPPEESISLTVEIDAADQLEHPSENAITVGVGLHPAIAALERLMYPAFPTVVLNRALAAFGSGAIMSEPAPLALFIWGPARVLPVRVNSVSITEQAFDTLLNPIQAKADLSLKVLTYRELEMTNPGFWVYMASFAQKEVMAALNIVQGADNIRGILPI